MDQYSIFCGKTRYEKLRIRCNNHTHHNFYYTMVLNVGGIYVEQRPTILARLALDIEHVFLMHVSFLFAIGDHFMIASDYIDSLEEGIPPESGSEYWVSQVAQEIFDEIIKKKRPDIAEIIKAHTSMKLG